MTTIANMVLQRIRSALRDWLEWDRRDPEATPTNRDLNGADDRNNVSDSEAVVSMAGVVRRGLTRLDGLSYGEVQSVLLIVLGFTFVVTVGGLSIWSFRRDGSFPSPFGPLVAFGIVASFPTAAWLLVPEREYRPYERVSVWWAATIHFAASILEVGNIRAGGGGWALAPMAVWPAIAGVILIFSAQFGRRPRWMPAWVKRRHFALVVALVAAWGGVAYYREFGNPVHLFFAIAAVAVVVASAAAVWDDIEAALLAREVERLAKQGRGDAS